MCILNMNRFFQVRIRVVGNAYTTLLLDIDSLLGAYTHTLICVHICIYTCDYICSYICAYIEAY